MAVAAALTGAGVPVFASPVQGTPGLPPPHKKESDVDPVTFGRVTGTVFDALTRRPIAGAAVSIRAGGTFADVGRTVATTDGAGHYGCEAEIGRTVKRTDALKVLGGVIFGGSLPGTSSQTARLDVDQLTVRVTAPGYRPFVGIVACRKRLARQFAVVMDPVHLAPEGSAAVSTSVPDWGAVRLLEIALDPPVSLPDKEVRASVRVASPPPGKGADGRDHPFTAHLLFADRLVELKERSGPVDGVYTFRGKFKSPKLPKETTEVVYSLHAVIGSPLPVVTPRAGDVLQVVASETLQTSALARRDAHRLYAAGDDQGAAAAFARLGDGPNAHPWDLMMAGRLHRRTGRPAAAAEFYARAYEKHRDLTIAAEYADALLASDQPATVVRDCAPALAEVRRLKKESELWKYVPDEFLISLITAYLAQGDITKSRELLDLLHRYPDAWSFAPDVDAEVRLSEAEAVLRSAPRDAAGLAGRARALRDLGRWPDAISAYDAALAVSPAAPELRRDRAYCALHLPTIPTSPGELDAAIAAAESLAPAKVSEDKKAHLSEFVAWHILGILRYARADRLRREGAADVGGAYDSAHLAFDGALRRGRPAVSRRPWNAAFYYAFTSGYSSLDAELDFDIRQSLLILRDRSDDALALTELGKALLESDLPALADDVLARASQADASVAVQCRYLRAGAALRMGQKDAAVKQLRDVIDAAPNHPEARLVLATLLEEAGDTEGARAQREAHARNYPAY